MHNAATDYVPCKAHNPRQVQRTPRRGQHEAEDSIIPHNHQPGATVCTSRRSPARWTVDRVAPTEEAHRGRESESQTPRDRHPRRTGETRQGVACPRRPIDGPAPPGKIDQVKAPRTPSSGLGIALACTPTLTTRQGWGGAKGVHFKGCLCACGQLPVCKAGTGRSIDRHGPSQPCAQGGAVHRVRFRVWGVWGGLGKIE